MCEKWNPQILMIHNNVEYNIFRYCAIKNRVPKTSYFCLLKYFMSDE